MRIPNFLKFPVYAFDLSDRSYKYLLLKETKGRIEVRDFGEGEIQPGIMVKGEIIKPDLLITLLKGIISKKKIKYVALALPEEKGFLRTVRLTGIKEEEIGQALELQLEEHVPLPAAEVAFNYSLGSKEKDHIDVILEAFPKKIVESYLDVFYRAGALPVYIESELNAAMRSIVPADFKKAAMLIDFGRTRTSFSIVEGGTLRFATTIPIGGLAVDEIISKTLNVNLTRAGELKRENGFLQKKGEEGVFEAIVPIVSAIKEEAQKYIDYWQTHSEKKEAPERVYLYGGEANLLGLSEYLMQETGIEVSVADPWINVVFPEKYLPEIEWKNSIRYTTPVGLSLNAIKEEEIL
ncbi:MAG: pilus assembly protein PilM [bacterium]|nr:pilus assembly protein PilM [bacterium]